MPINRSLFVLLSGFVSVFGLVSCSSNQSSSETPTPGVESQKPSEPITNSAPSGPSEVKPSIQLLNSDGVEASAVTINSTIPTAGLQWKLQLKGLDGFKKVRFYFDQNVDPSTVSGVSLTTFAEEKVLPITGSEMEIPLMELLVTGVFEKSDLNALVDIGVRAELLEGARRKQIGGRTFHLDLKATASSDAPMGAPGQAPVEPIRVNEAGSIFFNQDLMGLGEAFLICESGTLKIENVALSQLKLAHFTLPSRQAFLPRAPLQICRALLRDKLGTRLSRLATMDFGVQRPTVSMSSPIVIPVPGDGARLQIAELRIDNPGSIPLTVDLPTSIPNVTLRMAMGSSFRLMHWEKPIATEVSISWEGPQLERRIGPLRIEGGSTKRVFLETRWPESCFRNHGVNHPVRVSLMPGHSGTMSVFYHYYGAKLDASNLSGLQSVAYTSRDTAIGELDLLRVVGGIFSARLLPFQIDSNTAPLFSLADPPDRNVEFPCY